MNHSVQQRLRVLLISHTCQSAAEGQPKCLELARLGIDLCVVVPDRWRNYGAWRSPDVPKDPPYRLHVGKIRLPWLGPAQWYLHHYASLGKVIAEFKPDIIDVWEEPYGAVSFQAAYLRREYAPRAKLICETEQNLDKRLPPPFEFFRSYALAQADFVVGRNREAIGVVRNHGYRGPAEVVGNAVDPELFRPLDQGECRAEVGQNGFLVGYIGRLVEEKGLLDLVDALEFCPPRVKALFIGSGELAHVIPARAAARGMGSRVKVIPAQSLSQLPRWMNALDVLVLPSRTTSRWKEQFGRVIIEAQACGKPVIGSSSGAIPDVVGDGGIVVPERQPAALAQAINRLAAEPDLLRRMADAGARHVAQNYTWQAVASRMCAIYQRIAREPSVASEPSTASRAPAPAQALV